MIYPAQELNGAVRQPACQVACKRANSSSRKCTFMSLCSSFIGQWSGKGTCAVEALMANAALRVRVGHEHLRCELWALEVAARHLHQVTC